MPRSFFIFAGLCIGLLGSLGFSLAEDLPVPADPISSSYCTQNMQAVGDTLLVQYESFLTTYYAADKPSSDQLEDALKFYRYIEDSIWDTYFKSSAQKEITALSEANQSNNDCARVRDQYLQAIRFLMERHMLGSAVSKSTFKIVDGLKIMNTDLEHFDSAFRDVFPGLVSSMSTQFQCYLRTCVTR